LQHTTLDTDVLPFSEASSFHLLKLQIPQTIMSIIL